MDYETYTAGNARLSPSANNEYTRHPVGSVRAVLLAIRASRPRRRSRIGRLIFADETNCARSSL